MAYKAFRGFAQHGTARAAAEAGRGVEDHLLNGVGFGEAHLEMRIGFN